jgi:outer membrane protein
VKKRLFLILALMLSLSKLYAKEKFSHIQSPPLKIGYTNVEYLLGFLPEAKIIASEYASFEKQLNNQLGDKLEELQKQAQAFQQGQGAMTEEVSNKKKLELQQLQKKLERLELESQEKLYNKRNDLLQPVYEKITKVIKQVAQEHGYTHILNTNLGGLSVLLYVDEEHNISDLVLKKLGIDSDKEKDKKK